MQRHDFAISKRPRLQNSQAPGLIRSYTSTVKSASSPGPARCSLRLTSFQSRGSMVGKKGGLRRGARGRVPATPDHTVFGNGGDLDKHHGSAGVALGRPNANTEKPSARMMGMRIRIRMAMTT